MNKKIHSLALLVNLGIYGVAQAQEPTDTPVSHDDTIVVTAAEQNLQAPGVSTITADEIRKNPVARDVSEIIRTMPGVNLTGNSTSGQRGNNRQITKKGSGEWHGSWDAYFNAPEHKEEGATNAPTSA